MKEFSEEKWRLFKKVEGKRVQNRREIIIVTFALLQWFKIYSFESKTRNVEINYKRRKTRKIVKMPKYNKIRPMHTKKQKCTSHLKKRSKFLASVL